MYVYIVHYRPLCIYVRKYSSIPVIHVIHICIRICVYTQIYIHAQIRTVLRTYIVHMVTIHNDSMSLYTHHSGAQQVVMDIYIHMNTYVQTTCLKYLQLSEGNGQWQVVCMVPEVAVHPW